MKLIKSFLLSVLIVSAVLGALIVGIYMLEHPLQGLAICIIVTIAGLTVHFYTKK